MKQRKKTITREYIEYYEVCPRCREEIKGTSESQVKYNLELHLNKHKKKK